MERMEAEREERRRAMLEVSERNDPTLFPILCSVLHTHRPLLLLL
jgi:hypothetical protein